MLVKILAIDYYKAGNGEHTTQTLLNKQFSGIHMSAKSEAFLLWSGNYQKAVYCTSAVVCMQRREGCLEL